MLAARAAAIGAWMRPAREADILMVVSALTTVTKLRNWDQKTSGAILDTYVMDLADQPLFAIEQACTAYRRLEVGDGWMPIPGEVRQEAIRKAGPLRKELVEIARILNATVIPETKPEKLDANREKIAALLGGVRKDLDAARPRNERRRPAAEEREPELSAEERLALTGKLYREAPVTFGCVAILAKRRAA